MCFGPSEKIFDGPGNSAGQNFKEIEAWNLEDMSRLEMEERRLEFEMRRSGGSVPHSFPATPSAGYATPGSYRSTSPSGAGGVWMNQAGPSTRPEGAMPRDVMFDMQQGFHDEFNANFGLDPS